MPENPPRSHLAWFLLLGLHDRAEAGTLALIMQLNRGISRREECLSKEDMKEEKFVAGDFIFSTQML